MAFDTRELSKVRSSPRSSVGAVGAPIKFPGGSIIGSFLSIAIFCTLPTLSAKANDSTMELATGGLVFVKNNNIEMLSENLFISADEIRVRYRFLNKSNKNITVHVAFPLPDLKALRGDDLVDVPTDDPVNFVGFATKVDGRPIHANVEQKIYIKGRDQTDALKQLGIPLYPLRPRDVLDNLSTAKAAELTRLGLTEGTFPLWTLKTTFYWQQQFTSGHETIIEHRYKPIVGVTAEYPSETVGQDLKNTGERRKYCADADFQAALGKASGIFFSQHRIEYVLKTGANWSGPIKEFHLVVDKGAPGNLVTFCGQGVKQIGPTQFEMRKSVLSRERILRF